MIVNQIQFAILLVVPTELPVAVVPGHVEGGTPELGGPDRGTIGQLVNQTAYPVDQDLHQIVQLKVIKKLPKHNVKSSRNLTNRALP